MGHGPGAILPVLPAQELGAMFDAAAMNGELNRHPRSLHIAKIMQLLGPVHSQQG